MPNSALPKRRFDPILGWKDILSALAIVISLGSPAYIHFVLVPKAEELKSRPRLQVLSANKYDEDKARPSYQFELLNTGSVPAKSLRIQILSTASRDLADSGDLNAALRKHVYVYPSFPDDQIELRDGFISIKLAASVVPGGKLSVTIFEIPNSIKVYTDYDVLFVYASGEI